MDAQHYVRELNKQFAYLFAYASRINEIDTVAAVFGEFRGAQDAGWSTVATAHEVFDELQTLGTKGRPLTRPELRQVLCLYTQLSEAGGVYEGLLNVISVAQLKAYNLWPFSDLVRIRKSPRAVVGPNANAMFRRLAEAAQSIGMIGLARLLESTFRDDIRNAIAHADYIMMSDGLRLRRRNGGQPVTVTMAEISSALQIACYYFQLLRSYQQAAALSFRPGRTVVGRFSANPPMPWWIEYAENGGLSISSSAPGSQTDAAYLRQQRINNWLGGRMVSAFVAPGASVSTGMLEEISMIGFDVQLIDLDSQQYTELVTELEEHQLWDDSTGEAESDAVLMVTPLGFRRISSGSDFKAWLPAVEAISVS